METQPNKKHQIDLIKNFPDKLAAAISGLSDAQLDTPYREDGWTVRQVVHHLADSHLNGYLRMKLILTEANPLLKTYEQDVWGNLPDARFVPVEQSLSILQGLHARWSYFMENLDNSQWQRSRTHPESGVVTLKDLLQLYAGHCENHLSQILKLRKQKGW